jgi:hypothetical protein
LTLSGPGGVEETLELAAEPEEAETEFRLRARPRTAGPHLYHLELRAEALAGAWRAPLDVEVVVPPPLRLLLVESAPSFETRHLEGLLAARGARYTLRTRVSRERYRYEYRGRDASPPRFAAAELAELDAVVADPETLAALEPGERRELRNAVAAGLGLLVLPRRGLGPWPPWSGSGLAARGLAGRGELTGLAEPQGPSGGERLSLRLRWDGTSGSPPLDLAPRELVLRGAAAPLVDDVFGRTLAAALPEGRGQIGVALPIESYRWALAGHGEVHAAYWARLLGAVARPREGPSWEIGGGPVVAGEPLPVALRSPGSLPVASWRPPAGAPEPLSLRQQALDPDLWATTLWPRPGWNRLEAGATSAAVYAAPAGVWTVVDLVRRQRDTARRSLRGEPSGADRGATPRVRRALPRWPFYALFLAAVLYLWVGERLRPGW